MHGKINKEQLARIKKRAVIFFCLVFLAMIWPIYPIFSRIDPMILGIPFSLFYLIFLLVTSFLVLFGLYRLEEDSGEEE